MVDRQLPLQQVSPLLSRCWFILIEFSMKSKLLLSNDAWFREQVSEPWISLTLIPPGMFHYCTKEDLIPWLLIGWWFWCVYFHPSILNILAIYSGCFNVYLVTLSLFFFWSAVWIASHNLPVKVIMMFKGSPSQKKLVCIWPPTKLECSTKQFYNWDHTWIKIYVFQSQYFL